MSSSNKTAIYGLGAALVDHTFHVSDALLAELGCEKGTMRKVSPAERAALLERLRGLAPDLQPAGSISITLQTIAALGGHATFNCVVGSDALAATYLAEMEARGVRLDVTRVPGETGACVIMVTPDGERTMRTDPAVANEFTAPLPPLSRYAWCCMSAHLLLGGERGAAAIRNTIAAAHRDGVQVAFSLGSAFAMQTYAEAVLEVVGQSDLVIGNIGEWSALEERLGSRATRAALSARCPLLVTTMGTSGAELLCSGALTRISPVPCSPVNATGAGDVFLGTLLFHLARGVALPESAQHAATRASRSVSLGFHAFRASVGCQ